LPKIIHRSTNITAPSPAVDSRALPPLPSSRIEAAVLELAEALRRELISHSAIEQCAVEEYIEVECQRRRLRLMRDQIERISALGQLWRLLSNAMIQEKTRAGLDTSTVDHEAKGILQCWVSGDPAAHQVLLHYGIDIDEAISMGMAAHLPQILEFERERDRLARRARLLLGDIERTQTFRESRKLAELQDAEIIP